MSDLGPLLGPHARRLSQADERAARAAMGIQEEAMIIPMDMTRSPLFVFAMEEGDGLQIAARSTMSKRDAAAILRQVADAWEAEAVAAEEAARA